MQTQAAFSELFKYSKGRLKVIDALHDKRKANESDNWQDQKTPLDICEKMVALVPNVDLLWVVLFSLEFVEILVDRLGVLGENILFVADCTQESKAAEQMYGVKSCLFTKGMYITNGGMTNFTVSVRQGLSTMKFNKLAVIGNPPYQMMDGGGLGGSSAKPLYHLFIEVCIDNLSPDYLSMIVPSRWMAGGKGLDEFREKMMNDLRMKKVVHFPGSFDVFPTVEIGGGVNYFLWDKSHNGKCEFNGVERFLNEFDIIIQENEAISILSKVKSKFSSFLSEKCLARRPFGIRSNFSNWKSEGVPCYTQGLEVKFCSISDVEDRFKVLNKWKVCIGKANNTENPRVIAPSFVVPKNEVVSESYLVVNSFNTKSEAESFSSYVNSKLFRLLLKIRKNTQNICRETFAFVPDLQDYSKPWSDPELYKMFGLTKDEIDYIESKIKEFK